MLILTKFKDSTYCWTSIPYIYGPFSKQEAIAFGMWEFKMTRFQIDTGLKLFEIGYDIVTYKNLKFDSVKKINYEEMNTENEVSVDE